MTEAWSITTLFSLLVHTIAYTPRVAVRAWPQAMLQVSHARLHFTIGCGHGVAAPYVH